MQGFGQKLHTLRIKQGLTLKELAAKLGYSAHGHLSELEAGKKVPTVELVVKVAGLFNVSIDQLLREELTINFTENDPASKGNLMLIAFAERTPNYQEVEKIRLVLSTFQDGTGMLAQKEGLTLPGWRDFERTVALVFAGEAQENKAVFDVLLTSLSSPNARYGLSCKMRSELNRIIKGDGRATIEVSNSAGKFWQELRKKGLEQSNYRNQPQEVGTALVELVESWYSTLDVNKGGAVDLSKSFYLVLSYNKAGQYQLHQFSLKLPNPQAVSWEFTTKVADKNSEQAKRLIAKDETGVIIEWYGESGGQLKYYPLASDAIWASEVFTLETLDISKEYGILVKAASYFPELWQKATTDSFN